VKDYCVILSAHQNTEEKKDYILNTLEYFNKLDVDVCFTTHSPLFLDEISQKCKFTIYDSVNEFMYSNDWIDNVDVLDVNVDRGKTNLWRNYSGFNIVTHFASDFSPHLRSCFTLFTNAVKMVNDYGYKWFVYLEYDVESPKGGYCNWIEKKLDLLKSSDSNIFLYKRDDSDGSWPVGFFFISQPKIFTDHEYFINTSWKYSKREWIKNFQRCIFETAVEKLLTTSKLEVRSQSEYLSKESFDLWGCVGYDTNQVNKFNYSQVFTRSDLYFYCTLLPYMSEDNKLFIFWENSSSQNIEINYIKLTTESGKILRQNMYFIQNPGLWFMDEVDITGLENTKIILDVEYKFAESVKEYKEIFDMNYFNQIHDLLKRIVFD
jgi:hypothetical protein